MNINATGTFSKEDGALFVDLQFHPATELEHEIVAEFVRHQRRITISPTKLVFDEATKALVVKTTPEMEGEVLNVRIALDDEDAFDQAVHNMENRKRAQDGRPSIEDEAEAVKRRDEAQKAAEESGKTASEQAETERLAARDRIEKMAAEAIADRTLAAAAAPVVALPEPHPAEEAKEEVKPQAREPEKVQ